MDQKLRDAEVQYTACCEQLEKRDAEIAELKETTTGYNRQGINSRKMWGEQQLMLTV